jgi:hypothetical protein
MLFFLFSFHLRIQAYICICNVKALWTSQIMIILILAFCQEPWIISSNNGISTMENQVEWLTFTGQGKHECFVSWNVSISKSLIPPSLFEAMKWTAPLTDELIVSMHYEVILEGCDWWLLSPHQQFKTPKYKKKGMKWKTWGAHKSQQHLWSHCPHT